MKGSDSAIKSIVIIPGQLLDQLVSEINGCVDRQVEARKESQNQVGRDKADRAAAVCVCSGLGSIKLHNSGKLPEGTLRDLWKAYGCNWPFATKLKQTFIAQATHPDHEQYDTD